MDLNNSDNEDETVFSDMPEDKINGKHEKNFHLTT